MFQERIQKNLPDDFFLCDCCAFREVHVIFKKIVIKIKKSNFENNFKKFISINGNNKNSNKYHKITLKMLTNFNDNFNSSFKYNDIFT